MRKVTKIWLIAAIALLLLGAMIFVGGMTLLKWDFRKLDTSKMQTSTYEPVGEIRSISGKQRIGKNLVRPVKNRPAGIRIMTNKDSPIELPPGKGRVTISPHKSQFKKSMIFIHHSPLANAARRYAAAKSMRLGSRVSMPISKY